MAVVRNLMVRIGADYSAARQAMQGATRELGRFKRDTQRTINDISGRRGLGRINTEFRDLRRSITSSLSQLSGARGIGGVASAIGELRPALSAATAGLRGLGVAAGGAAVALGPLGIGLAALTAALGVAVVGLYQASQTAVKFEADLGRLNMQLRGGSRDFIEWARAQGLARTTAVEMGATFSTLLSSFIRDSQELQSATTQLVQATRVTASATGRNIEDVMERMRSGLLGNTEAIEDLGIFVNVSMIESTKAFRRFAGDRSWEQLDFQTQQQIRLAAILEQTYARYGDELQNNTLTRQTLLIEQLKEIKLNLSQAFLPIWDAVLPALTRLAESLAYVTEQIARFTFWLRGWDYDQQTKGTDRQTDAVDDQSRAYDDLASSARKARGELAAFDRLNLLGSGGGGAGGGTGGGGIGTPGITPGGGTGGGFNLPEIPPLPRLRLEFDPPSPPDAGIGAVATAVVNTVNGMIAETKARLAQMWGDLQVQTQTGLVGQILAWRQFALGVIGEIIPGLVLDVRTNWQTMWDQLGLQTQAGALSQQLAWQNMWNQLQTQTGTGRIALQSQLAEMYANILQNNSVSTRQVVADWQTMLNTMNQSLAAQRPVISTQWNALNQQVESIQTPLNNTRTSWIGTLAEMAQQLGFHGPNMVLGFLAIENAISNIGPGLDDLKVRWNTILNSIRTTADNILSKIINKINDVINAWNRFKRTLGIVHENIMAFTDAAANALTFGLHNKLAEMSGRSDVVENQQGLAGTLGEAFGTAVGIAGGAGALRGALSVGKNALRELKDLFKGLGIPVPAFAAGGIVSGPTLAMVGEYPGAVSNPEVIAPLSDLEAIVGNDNRELVTVLRQILQAVRENRTVQAAIERDSVGRAAVDYVNDERRRGRNPLLSP